MKQFIHLQIQKLQKILAEIEGNDALLHNIEKAAQTCLNVLNQGGKILFVGNGGSAADAQHLAAEIVVKLRFNRPALPALALTTDTSVLTAASNDNGYESVFARQVEALGQSQDVLIAISTSGRSPNILKALGAARIKGMKIIGFSGMHSKEMDAFCDVMLNVPAIETSKIQECHILFGHILCELIETTICQQYDPAKQLQEAMAL